VHSGNARQPEGTIAFSIFKAGGRSHGRGKIRSGGRRRSERHTNSLRGINGSRARSRESSFHLLNLKTIKLVTHDVPNLKRKFVFIIPTTASGQFC
jgi:hypothetical protein